jgi:hypothetical protein
MDLSRLKSASFNSRLLILGIVVWWILMTLGYAVTVLRMEHINTGIRESGINIVSELAKHISVKLLEKDTPAIRRQIVDISKRKDILYLAVSDYRDEIVAVAGAQNVKPVINDSVQKKDQITFWKGEFPSPKKIVGFTSGIRYAGTQIGEIYLALSAAKTVRVRNQFIIAAAISFLCLLLFIVVLSWRKINVNPRLLKDFFRHRRQESPKPDNHVITCPMCGTKKTVNADGFYHLQPYKKSIAKISNPAPNPEYHADLKGIDLSEIAKRRELYSIKRQIILRCAEIIQKLTV